MILDYLSNTWPHSSEIQWHGRLCFNFQDELFICCAFSPTYVIVPLTSLWNINPKPQSLQTVSTSAVWDTAWQCWWFCSTTPWHFRICHRPLSSGGSNLRRNIRMFTTELDRPAYINTFRSTYVYIWKMLFYWHINMLCYKTHQMRWSAVAIHWCS